MKFSLSLRRNARTDASQALPGVLDVLGANVISLVERVVPFLSDQLAGNFTEDCLTLNVQRPAGIDPSVKLPVMFWVRRACRDAADDADLRRRVQHGRQLRL